MDRASVGPDEPANHIGKLVTVDTPHFGSELAVKNTEDIAKDFPGLKTIIDDLDAQENGMSRIHTLVSAKLDLNWYSYASRAEGEFVDSYGELVGSDGLRGFLQIFTPVMDILGWVYGATTDWATDLTLKVKGPYVGKYHPVVYVDGVGPEPFNTTLEFDTIMTMDAVSRKARRDKESGGAS